MPESRLRRVLPAVAVVGCLALSACGTRQSDEAIRDAAGGTTQLAGDRHVATPDNGSAGATLPPSANPNGTGGVRGGVATTGRTTGGATTGGVTTGGAAGGGTTGSTGSGSSGSADATASTITIGSVGTFSGPVGAFVKETSIGTRIWAQYVNAHGGVNGHKVNLVVGDDGGDPARYNTLVQQFVEQHHAIAFMFNTLSFAPNGNNSYLNSKKIFMFGDNGGLEKPYQDPYVLTPVPSGRTYADAILYAFAKAAKPKGAMKLASYACSDFALCDNFDGEWTNPKVLRATGFTLVDRGRPSLTQPDFTTYCINAKNAGATAVVLGLDTSSLKRFAADCKRQNYSPLLASADGVVTPDIATDPNMEGFVIGGKLASFTAVSTVPGLTKLKEAVRLYGGGRKISGAMAYGWLLGTFFEHAGRALPANPTYADVGKGVYALRGDNLDGMTYPLTFTPGQPSPRKLCFGVTVVHQGAFQQGPGPALQCAPLP